MNPFNWHEYVIAYNDGTVYYSFHYTFQEDFERVAEQWCDCKGVTFKPHFNPIYDDEVYNYKASSDDQLSQSQQQLPQWGSHPGRVAGGHHERHISNGDSIPSNHHFRMGSGSSLASSGRQVSEQVGDNTHQRQQQQQQQHHDGLSYSRWPAGAGRRYELSGERSPRELHGSEPRTGPRRRDRNFPDRANSLERREEEQTGEKKGMSRLRRFIGDRL